MSALCRDYEDMVWDVFDCFGLFLLAVTEGRMYAAKVWHEQAAWWPVPL